MAASVQEDSEPVVVEETGVYNDVGNTVVPQYVRQKLGGVGKGDTILWKHEADGTITLDVKRNGDGDEE